MRGVLLLLCVGLLLFARPPATNDTVIGRHAAQPVVLPSPPGGWDDERVYLPRACRHLDGTLYREAETGTVFIAYTGSGSAAGTDNDRVGLLTTRDFVEFVRVSARAPILDFGTRGYDPSGEHWDGTDVAATACLFTGGVHGLPRFLLFFEGNRRPNDWKGPPEGDQVSIGVAESHDGIRWIKRPKPILEPGPRTSPDSNDVYFFTPRYDAVARSWSAYYTGHVRSEGFTVMSATAPSYTGPWKRQPTDLKDVAVTQAWKAGGREYLVGDRLATLTNTSLYTSPNRVEWTYVRSVAGVNHPPAWDDGAVYGTETFWDHRAKRWRLLYYGRNRTDSISGIAHVSWRGPRY